MARIITSSILMIILVQVCSFYTISDRRLIEQIGLNYETNLIFEKENNLKIGFVSKMDLTEKQIQNNFSKFRNRKIKICKTQQECTGLKGSEEFYIYWFNSKIKNPFWINKIEEGEFAEFFGASWESEYIWVIYKWVFIEKESTGIS